MSTACLAFEVGYAELHDARWSTERVLTECVPESVHGDMEILI